MDADRTYRLAISLWAINGALVVSILTPTNYYITASRCTAGYEQQAYDELHMFSVFFSGEFWTAAATVVIAIFTIVLACVTRTQARLSRDALIHRDRAFVFVTTINLSPERDENGAIVSFIFLVEWKNSGNTPTKNMFYRDTMGSFDAPITDSFDFQTLPPLSAGCLALPRRHILQLSRWGSMMLSE